MAGATVLLLQCRTPVTQQKLDFESAEWMFTQAIGIVRLGKTTALTYDPQNEMRCLVICEAIGCPPSSAEWPFGDPLEKGDYMVSTEVVEVVHDLRERNLLFDSSIGGLKRVADLRPVGTAGTQRIQHIRASDKFRNAVLKQSRRKRKNKRKRTVGTEPTARFETVPAAQDEAGKMHGSTRKSDYTSDGPPKIQCSCSLSVGTPQHRKQRLQQQVERGADTAMDFQNTFEKVPAKRIASRVRPNLHAGERIGEASNPGPSKRSYTTSTTTMTTRSKRRRMNVPAVRFHDMPIDCATLVLTMAVGTSTCFAALIATCKQMYRLRNKRTVRRHLVQQLICPLQEQTLWRKWIAYESEYMQAKKKKEHWGHFEFPDDPYVWSGILCGPASSPYAGSEIAFEAKFPHEYPFKPFTIQFKPFKVPLFHPNIHPTRGWLDVEFDWYTPGLPVYSTMVAVQNLLAEPDCEVLSDAADEHAAKVFMGDRQRWHHKVAMQIELAQRRQHKQPPPPSSAVRRPLPKTTPNQSYSLRHGGQATQNTIINSQAK